MHNRITIHGRLGKDPELKNYTNNKGETRPLINFSVAVDRVGDGTDWFPVTMFGKRAEVIDKYFRKGSQIVVTGRMQCDVVDKNGEKRSYWKLIADDFDFCDKNENAGSVRQDPAPVETDSFQEAEDDIPF